MNSVEEKVLQVIMLELHYDMGDIGLDYDLVQDLGADSLEIMKIMYQLEDDFSIEFPDEEIPFLSTPRKIADFIDSQKSCAK